MWGQGGRMQSYLSRYVAVSLVWGTSDIRETMKHPYSSTKKREKKEEKKSLAFSNIVLAISRAVKICLLHELFIQTNKRQHKRNPGPGNWIIKYVHGPWTLPRRVPATLGQKLWRQFMTDFGHDFHTSLLLRPTPWLWATFALDTRGASFQPPVQIYWCCTCPGRRGCCWRCLDANTWKM